MATLTVWTFNTPGGAAGASKTVQDLFRENLIVINDAAVVEWEAADKKPTTRPVDNLAGAEALGCAFWGLLFGLIFLVPLLGGMGAATRALSGALADVGIDDTFVDSVRDQVTPGTSALFVLTSQTVLDTVRDAFGDDRPGLIFTNLTDAQQRALVEVFGA